MSTAGTLSPRSLLFVPADKPRMIEKATTLPADLIVLDLEDAVREEQKRDARRVIARSVARFDGRPVAVRVNGPDSDHFHRDIRAVRRSNATHIVVAKVEKAETVSYASWSSKPVVAMIETPAGVMNVGPIASASGIAGLVVGTNDLAAALRLPPSSGREAMALALQLVVLAARARELWAIDGVFNALADADGLAAECRAGRALGFDGKSLIHPDQIDVANTIFSPTAAELEDAAALVAAATGGAERFRDRMVEDMHVDAACALLERAGLAGQANGG